MQPDAWHWFAAPEPGHAMLPDGPDMYLVCPPGSDNNFSAVSAAHTAAHTVPPAAAEPPRDARSAVMQSGVSVTAGPCVSRVGESDKDASAPSTATAEETTSNHGAEVGSTADIRSVDIETLARQVRELERQQHALLQTRAKTSAAHQAGGNTNPTSHALTAPQSATSHALTTTRGNLPRAGSMEDVMWALMNHPHPLDTLADPGAYLEKGSISRYHNPDNYTAAIGRLIYMKRKSEGRIPSWVHNAYSRSLGMEAAAERGELSLIHI